MFDKFIESNSEADQHPRRNYFLVSTIIVGILFITGVIASIYAQDIGLGTDEFELSSILAPVVPEAPEPPQPDREQPQQQNERTTLPMRQINMARVDEFQAIPDSPSVVPNTHVARPAEEFVIGPDNLAALTAAPTGGPIGSGDARSSGSRPTESELVEPERNVEPPPVIKLKAPISKGVVNGLAIDLPKPLFSKMAQSVGAGGDVTVQVLIDEKGTVVSAKALKGHPLLLQESERAARRAKFKPTLLSHVPVKVTGVITYRFSK